MAVQAINGRCPKCGYRLAWMLVREKMSVERTAFQSSWSRVAVK